MKKLELAAALLMTTAVCYAEGEGYSIDFDGRGGGCAAVAAAALEVPAAQPCSGGPAARTVFSPVSFAIREGFYGPGTIAAFDQVSGDKAVLKKDGAGWKAELTVNGAKASARITAQGERYTYISGGSAVVLERRGEAWLLGGLEGASAAPTGGETLAVKGGGLDLVLDREGVTGFADRRSAAGLAALYAASLRAVPGILRAPGFLTREEIDENGGGWTSCSNTGNHWTMTDTEYKVVQQHKQDQYVCKVEVSWDCRWRSCDEPNPHTNPGQCYCKASCYKSSRTTDECFWQAKE